MIASDGAWSDGWDVPGDGWDVPGAGRGWGGGLLPLSLPFLRLLGGSEGDRWRTGVAIYHFFADAHPGVLAAQPVADATACRRVLDTDALLRRDRVEANEVVGQPLIAREVLRCRSQGLEDLGVVPLEAINFVDVYDLDLAAGQEREKLVCHARHPGVFLSSKGRPTGSRFRDASPNRFAL